MKRIVLSLPFADDNLEKIRQAGIGADLVEIPSGHLTCQDVHNADALLAYPSMEILQAAQKLSWLQLPTAGVEAFAENPLVPEKLLITNSSGAFGDAIAEYILGEILAVNRNLYTYYQNQQVHCWKSAGRESSLYGRTVVILGVGDIGSSIARLFIPFGCRIIGIRRTVGKFPEGFHEVYTSECLPNVLSQADLVIGALPHTKFTAGLMNRTNLSLMKPTALLVNVGRGSLIDLDALCDLLKSGKLRGAVLDVFPSEPLGEDSPLWTIPNLYLTPHISGRSFAHNTYTEAKIAAIFAENIRRFLTEQPLINRVDRKTGYADRSLRTD